MPEASLLSLIPDLSTSVVSILGLVYVVLKFLDALDKRTIQHSEAMKEREMALREVEKEVRNSILNQLSRNTQAMERVMNHLDKN